MVASPDTLLVTGDAFQQISIDQVYITPVGGTQTTLANVINGGTVAQTLPAGSTIASPIITGIQIDSITNAITASTTQTLAGAVALTKAFNVVSVVGTAADAVKLNTAGVANIGQVQWVINNGSSALAVFAAETATAIDTHATNTAATLTTLHRAAFVQNTASTWVTAVVGVSAAS